MGFGLQFFHAGGLIYLTDFVSHSGWTDSSYIVFTQCCEGHWYYILLYSLYLIVFNTTLYANTCGLFGLCTDLYLRPHLWTVPRALSLCADLLYCPDDRALWHIHLFPPYWWPAQGRYIWSLRTDYRVPSGHRGVKKNYVEQPPLLLNSNQKEWIVSGASRRK